jgi:hypothetical protein
VDFNAVEGSEPFSEHVRGIIVEKRVRITVQTLKNS